MRLLRPPPATALARQARAAATARSSPGRPTSDERTSRSPRSASARAAGGSPSRSASARSSAPRRSRPQPRLLAKPLPLRGSRSSEDWPGTARPGPARSPAGARAARGALQPVEAGGRLLAAPGGADELPLDAVALARAGPRAAFAGPVPREARGLRAARRPARGAPRARRARAGRSAPRSRRSRRAASRRAPPRVAWSASGRSRFCTSASRSRARSTCDRDPRELQLGAVAAALEASEPGRLLDERAPLVGLRGEDLLDRPWPMIEPMLASRGRRRRAARRDPCGGPSRR